GRHTRSPRQNPRAGASRPPARLAGPSDRSARTVVDSAGSRPRTRDGAARAWCSRESRSSRASSASARACARGGPRRCVSGSSPRARAPHRPIAARSAVCPPWLASLSDRISRRLSSSVVELHPVGQGRSDCVILSRPKLGAPGQPELGVGAIAPGVRVVDERAVRELGISAKQLEWITAAETEEMERRQRRYRGDRREIEASDRTVILVDDGLATGVTARAAIHALRRQRPRRIVFAAPVCASETAERLRSEVDEVVCVAAPRHFGAVGSWYADFEQTTDDEVLK